MGCDQLVNEGYTTVHFPERGKRNRFLFHLRQGIGFGYPICCVLRFSLEMAFLDGKTIPIEEGLGARRGSVKRNEDSVYIPCNLFHFKTQDVNDG